MKTNELIEAGRRIARPCALLRPRGTQGAAIWGDDWLTIGLKHVPALGLRGLLHVSLDDDRGGTATHLPNRRLSATVQKPRMMLFAHSATLLPPLDALDEGLTVKASAKSIDAYERAFQSEHPLYRDDTWVMLGGHAQLWPEDDVTLETEGHQLVLWTFRDSEPWVEVWHKKGHFTVLQRRT